MGTKRPQHTPESQTDKFKNLARDLEANEDEKAFEETLKKIAPSSRPKQDERPTD
jgi:hypothetical protein